MSTAPSSCRSLDIDAVVHDFDEVAIIEDVVKPTGDFAASFSCFCGIDALQNRATEFAADTARQADDAFAVLFQDFFVDPRLEVETFQRRGGGQFDQVFETGAVFGQQGQVIAGRLAAAGTAFVEPAARGDVGFVTDDRIDARPSLALR